MPGELFRKQTPKISLDTNSSLLLEGLPISPVQEHNREGMGFPSGSDGKESASNAADPGSIPGSGRSPGGGNGNPLQYSCLENSMDRGAWWAHVRTCTHTHTHTHTVKMDGVSETVESRRAAWHRIQPGSQWFAKASDSFLRPLWGWPLKWEEQWTPESMSILSPGSSLLHSTVNSDPASPFMTVFVPETFTHSQWAQPLWSVVVQPKWLEEEVAPVGKLILESLQMSQCWWFGAVFIDQVTGVTNSCTAVFSFSTISSAQWYSIFTTQVKVYTENSPLSKYKWPISARNKALPHLGSEKGEISNSTLVRRFALQR